jgi:protein-S-isoprenylcysteine O-methyltransferase Ste14
MFIIVLIFFSFACIHSITTSIWLKHACGNLIGDIFVRGYYRAFYNALSFVTVAIAFFLIARVPDGELWTAPAWLMWPMHGIQIAAMVFGAQAFKHLDVCEFMGFKQVWKYITRREVSGDIDGLTRQGLVTTGVYGIVRHPLYLAGIIIFTINPHFTLNTFTTAVLADIYFLFGMIIEERRFVKIFGAEYRKYKERIPMMIPRLLAAEHPEKSRNNKS